MTLGKYNDLMNNIVVTEDMKNRILQNIEDELDGNTDTKSNDKEKVSSTDKKEKISFFHTQTYKTWLSVAAAVLIVTASGIAIKTVIGDGYRRHDSAAMSEGAVGNMTPAQESFEAPKDAAEDTVEEAAETDNAPVEKVEAKNSMDSADQTETEKESTVEPHVYKTDSERVDYVALTGDYTEYSVIEDTHIDDITVHLMGDGDTVSSAMWFDGSCVYAVCYPEPVSKEVMTEEIKKVIAKN